MNDDIVFCQACHSDLKLKSDPLDISHQQLTADRQWDTCLGCHDFHGNHIFKSPTTLAAKADVHALRDYLASGPSPYGNQLHFEAKKP